MEKNTLLIVKWRLAGHVCHLKKNIKHVRVKVVHPLLFKTIV